jgi:hypothetical protein
MIITSIPGGMGMIISRIGVAYHTAAPAVNTYYPQ